MRVQNTLLCVAMIATWLGAQTVVTPMKVHRDGEASATGYSGWEKEIMVDGGAVQVAGWATFQTNGYDLSGVTTARLALYLKTLDVPGTVDIYAMTATPANPENAVPIGDLSYGTSPLASVSLTSADVEKIIFVDVTAAVSGGTFPGVVLMSDDGAAAAFDAKEGNLPPVVLLSYDAAAAAASWHTGSSQPGSGLGKAGDMYLNVSNGDVYQKTSAGAWQLDGNIAGADGAPGTSSWTDGSGQVRTDVNVGIGTDPSTALDVAGTVTATSFAGSGAGLTNVPVGPHAHPGVEYSNVIIVAKSGGDFTSVSDAVASITDASRSNQYLIWVAPGTYKDRVVLPQNVHLQGSGRSQVTLYSDEGTALTLSSFTSVSDMYISCNAATGVALQLAYDVSRCDIQRVDIHRNSTGPDTAMAIDTSVDYCVLRDININVSRGSDGVGLSVAQWSSVQFENLTVSVFADNATGIFNDGGITIRQGKIAVWSNGDAVALNNVDDAIIKGVEISVRGSGSVGAISNEGTSATLYLEDALVSSVCTGTDTAYGLKAGGGAHTRVTGGRWLSKDGTYAQGFYISGYGTTAELLGISCEATGAHTKCTGILTRTAATVTVNECHFTAIGAISAVASDNMWGANLTANNSTFHATDANSNTYGLRNEAIAVLHSCSMNANGATSAYGVMNDGSGVELRLVGCDVLATAASSVATGASCANWAKMTLDACRLSAQGGANAHGLATNGTPTVDAAGCRIVASGGSTESYGVIASTGGSITITQSTVEGVTGWAMNGGASLLVSNTRLVGGALGATGGMTDCTCTSRNITFSSRGCP
ncbi:MAG: hypothetical protein GF331_18155 [Chitinivibrionales bacterium]|nr:hypothetical protein [Chitinivibrionales bacterium]